jgi:hypothetical protein
VLRVFDVTTDLKTGDEVQIYGLGISPKVYAEVENDIGMTVKV